VDAAACAAIENQIPSINACLLENNLPNFILIRFKRQSPKTFLKSIAKQQQQNE